MDNLTKRKDHLVEYQVPEYFLSNYYSKIKNDGPLYAILSMTEDSSKIFFSPYKGKKNENVTYVFYRLEDAKNYIKALKASKLAENYTLVAWEATVSDMVSSIQLIIKKEKQQMTRRKFHVISSIYLHGEFRDIEFLCTDNVELIN